MLTDTRFAVHANGDSALDIRFDAAAGETLSERIIALAEAVESLRLEGVVELVPAYQCLTVCFDPLRLPRADTGAPNTARLEETLRTLTAATLPNGERAHGNRRLIRIPVCYEEAFAPDMQSLCEIAGLTAEEIIARHSAPHYLVHMLGFTPGFLYLGGLDQRLHCPRKARPELQVPAGSVGIGGAQTGIYPQATPGGWQIIGRTPLSLFRPQQPTPYIARPLDRIQFVPISAAQFADVDPLAEPESMVLKQTQMPGVQQ